jgi:hypothetical protein
VENISEICKLNRIKIEKGIISGKSKKSYLSKGRNKAIVGI